MRSGFRFLRLLPLQRVDEMFHIGREKINNGFQGIGVGCIFKIECAANEMPAAIGHEKLSGRGCIPSYPEKYCRDPPSADKKGVPNGRSDHIILRGQVKGVIHQFVKFIHSHGIPVGSIRRLDFDRRSSANDLVADKDSRIQLRKIEIYPVWIFRCPVKKSTVLHDAGIGGIFKLIRKAFPVEANIFLFRKLHPEIPSFLGGIVGIAGKQQAKGNQ